MTAITTVAPAVRNESRIPVPVPTGTAISIRRVRATDALVLERFYAELSPESRLLRFLGMVSGLSHRQSVTFCTPDHDHREGFVAVLGRRSDADERIVAHLCLEPDGTDTAEVAIAVADAWQRHGLGRRLMASGLRWAHQAGVRRFTATMFADNAGIHRLLLGLGLPWYARPLVGGISAISVDLTAFRAAAA